MSQQIPVLSIVFMIVSACIALFVPIFLLVGARRRYHARMLPALVGAVVFVLFALVLEQAAYAALLRISEFSRLFSSQMWFYSVVSALMAGLFEETGRMIAFSAIGKRYRNLPSALSYGIGHGGIESILLVGLSVASSATVAILHNNGALESTLALVSAEQAQVYSQSVEMLASTPASHYLAGGIERLAAIAFHIAASVLVWMAVSGRGRWYYYPLAILFHTLLNIPAGLYKFGAITNIWLVEVILLVTVAVVCLVVYRLYEKSSQLYTSLLSYEPIHF